MSIKQFIFLFIGSLLAIIGFLIRNSSAELLSMFLIFSSVPFFILSVIEFIKYEKIKKENNKEKNGLDMC